MNEKIQNFIANYYNYIIISSLLVALALIIIVYINSNTPASANIYLSMEDVKNLVNQIMNELLDEDVKPNIPRRMNHINLCIDSFLKTIDLSNPQNIETLKATIIEIIRYSGAGG